MEPLKKFSPFRVFTLFSAGALFFVFWIGVRYASMDTSDKALFVKRACIQAGSSFPSLALRFKSCREIPPESINKFSCGPDFFPAGHYCRDAGSKNGCKVEYFTDVVNYDKTVECSCRVSCEEESSPAKPAKGSGKKKI